MLATRKQFVLQKESAHIVCQRGFYFSEGMQAISKVGRRGKITLGKYHTLAHSVFMYHIYSITSECINIHNHHFVDVLCNAMWSSVSHMLQQIMAF